MSFGYKMLGFGSGGGSPPYQVRFLVVAGGGGTNSSGAGGGGFRTIGTKAHEVAGGGSYTITVGDGGPGNPIQFSIQ